MDSLMNDGMTNPLLDATRMGSDQAMLGGMDLSGMDLGMPRMPQQQMPQQQLQMAPQAPPQQLGLSAYQQQQQRQGQALMAFAGGMGSGENFNAGLGAGFAGVNAQVNRDRASDSAHEQAMATLGLGRDKLEEARRQGTAKIDALVAKSKTLGTAKVQNMGNGTYAVTHPGEEPILLTNDEYQRYGVMIQDKKDTALVTSMGLKKDLEPLPSNVLADNKTSEDAISGVGKMNQVMDSFDRDMAAGKLNLGLFSNLFSQGLNYTGNSTAESSAYNNFKGNMEGLRNSYLAIQKGTQTEGDATRAMSQLMSNLNDPQVVKDRFAELRHLNALALKEHQQRIASNYATYGKTPPNFNRDNGQPEAPAAFTNVEKARDLAATVAAPTQAYPKAKGAGLAAASTTGQAGFPRVSPAQQTTMDGGRLDILKDEWSKATAPADKAALYREISNVPGGKEFLTTQKTTPAKAAQPNPAIAAAKAAIAKGAPKDAVLKRLKDAGISTEGF